MIAAHAKRVFCLARGFSGPKFAAAAAGQIDVHSLTGTHHRVMASPTYYLPRHYICDAASLFRLTSARAMCWGDVGVAREDAATTHRLCVFAMRAPLPSIIAR